MFDRIDQLITKHGFALQSWDDRYSKGVWAALTPVERLLDEVRDATSDGDLDMEPATEFLSSSEWLPIVAGKTFLDALSELEALLMRLPQDQLARNTTWSSCIVEALEHLRDIRNASPTYGDSSGKFVPLPVTFADLARSKDRR